MESWDPIWDNVFANQEWGKYPSESLIQFIARNYYKANRPRVKILEVGCGTGANIWFISREGFDTYGIDASKVAIDIAVSRLQREGLSASLSIGDISILPYEDNFFDAVIDNQCLYTNNQENTRRILQEIRRVLKPQGKLYSRTFSDKMYLGKTYDEIGLLEFNNVSDGPLSGKGFIRLSNKASIHDIYGSVFTIESIDSLDYTSHNEQIHISDYVILAVK
ncbi:MAG: class I SAM-dependent methyltransferase [Chitinophaga sp.]|uniref:class I SAM-dependent methyltransferase n=1 Tax=Chitinophaga sp. TaxID=1869181 RepID=UPI001B08E5CD|nr:class I SAM-dependent methyltransferase [Chitinophaga sp.]MBO9731733.1 class I SAM-dependent methyltransferase [Chitinophaga sp.]